MTHPVPEWAGTAVAWRPEVPGRDFVCTVPDAGSWTVAFSDFAPQHDPISLEMRAESISQLVNGDALRCGETERVESTGASAGADIVAGRDRATVQGKLHEHTGRELVEMAAHLDTSVGGSLDVHAGLDDTVLLAGHMVDTWNGGTAVVAAVADDLVAGGGLRVTAPLDVWAHGLIGVEERAVTCTADVLLLELAATHYEREYNAGVHMAALAQFVGALFVTTRTQFCPLMEVSSGVRNLISAPVPEAGGESPSPTPPPSEGGSGGTAAASLTVSSATDMGRTVEAGTDMATSSVDDLASLRHGPEFTEGDDLRQLRQILDNIDDSSYSFRSSDGAASISDSTGTAENLTELNHASDSAEQLASLQDGESVRMGGEVATEQPPVITEILQSIDMQWANELDELDFGRRTDDFPDVSLLDPDGAGGTHHAGDVVGPGTGVAELNPPPSVRHDFDDWKDLLDRLLADLAAFQDADNQLAAGSHQEAIGGIANEVLATYQRFGGNIDDLTEDASDIERAIEAYRALDDMIDEAIAAGDAQRAVDIWGAQSSINVVTSEYASVLNEGFGIAPQAYETPSWSTTWSTSSSSTGSTGSTSSGSGGPAAPPTITHTADSDGVVLLALDEWDEILAGNAELRVVDADGNELARADYTIKVHNYTVMPDGSFYAEIVRPGDGTESVDSYEFSSTFMPNLDEDAPPLPPRSELEEFQASEYWQALEAIRERTPEPFEVGEGATGGWGAVPPGRSGDPGRVGFGRPQAEAALSPRSPGVGTPGFRRAAAPLESRFPFNPRERFLRQLKQRKGLSRGDIFDIHTRFVDASAAREVPQDTREWRSMAFLIGHLQLQAAHAGDGWNFYSVFSEEHHLSSLINLLELFKAPSNV